MIKNRTNAFVGYLTFSIYQSLSEPSMFLFPNEISQLAS